MALYDLKEFLTFDDVAEYLTDKGVYEFDVSQEYDYRKLETLLIELVRFEKITPVFYNRSAVDVISYQYDENNKQRMKYIDGGIFLEGYYSIDPTAYEFILKNGIIQTEYPKRFIEEDDILEYQTYTIKDNMGYGGLNTKIEYKPYKLIDDYKPKTLDDCYVNYQLFADDISIIKKDELLYPIAQLDTLFLKQQKDNLQQQINAIDSQLDDKELPTRTANNASKIILAMAELLEWDLSKPFADDTNGKIREILEKQGNVLSKDTVGQWLKQAYDIGK